MAFDPTTAKPAAGGFDPSTARPVGGDDDISPIGAALSSAGQGLTLGWLDEAVGLVSPDAKQAMREYQTKAQEQYPVTSFAGEVGGAVLPAVLAAPFTGGTSLSAIPAAAGRSGLRRLGQTAAIGTGAGAVAGGGFSEADITSTNFAADVGKGAAGGAAFSMLMPLAGKGIQSLATKSMEALPIQKTAETLSQRKILEALSRDQFDPLAAIAKLREIGPTATLADLGPNLMGLTRAATAVPGEARTIAEKFYKERSGAARERITNALQRSFGTEENFYGELRGLQEQMKTLAKPFYERAYQAQMPMTPTLRDLASRPTIMEAIEQAKRNAADEGRDLPTLVRVTNGKPEFVQTPAMQDWDEIKRGLDQIISDNKDPITGKMNSKALRANNLRVELINELDEINPDYAQARRVYAGPAANAEALQEGRRFAKEDFEITEEALSKMSDSQQAYFRAGALRAIRDKVLSNANPRTEIERLNRTGKLRAIMPDDDSYKSLVDVLENEATLQETANKIRGGSPTARIDAEVADLGVNPGIVADAARGNYGQAAAGLIGNLSARAKLPSDRIRETIAGPLMETDPAVQQTILEGILPAAQKPQGSPFFSPVPYAAGVTGGLLGGEI